MEDYFCTFFLCGLMLLGSLFTTAIFVSSSHVFAQAKSKNFHPNRSGLKFHTAVSPQKGMTTRNHAVLPRATGNIKPQSSPNQDLTVTSNAPGGPNFQVGQTFTLELVMNNVSNTRTFDAHSGAGIGVSFWSGLSNIVVTASNWAISISASTSPTVFFALYTGPPVSPGGVFPLITINGVFTSEAVPTFTTAPVAFDSQHSGTFSGVLMVNVSPLPGTVTVTPTPTGTVTPTPTPLTSPNVNITNDVVGGLVYQVGQTVTMNLTASNSDASNALGVDNEVYIGDVLPFGFDNISALGGGNWSVNTSSNTSPSLFTAKYVGPPIAPGGTFPPITVSGTLTSNAVPGFDNISVIFDNQFLGANTASVHLVVTSTGTATPTPTSTVMPTSTVVATPTPTPIALLPSLPDVSMTQSGPVNETVQVGQTVTYALNVASTATSGPIGPSNMIKVVAVFPLGLTNMTATGSNWRLLITSTSSPTLVVATYQGQYPVATGTHLPPILLQGTVVNTAVPQLTSTALVQVSGDSHPDNNLVITTIQVAAAGTPTQILQPSPTPTSIVVPTATISTTVASLPESLPDLSVNQTSIGTSPFVNGQQLGYVLSVKNERTIGLITSQNLIHLTEVIPVGLTDVSVSAGSGWRIVQSSTTSPLLIRATYTGSYPVTPGTTFAPIFVIGKIAAGSISSITCTAVIGVSGDLNPRNNLANNTAFVTPLFSRQSTYFEKRQRDK